MRAAIVLAALVLCTLTARPLEQDQIADGSATPAFREIWAYLLRGEEGELTGAEPITDLCFFGVNLARDGRIRETVARPAVRLNDGSQPAVHLVIAELSNQALMHFAMDPRYGVTPLLIGDICRVSSDFDGVQIDFEAVSRDDAEVFLAFLKELKSRLPAGKKLSIAVPARTRLIADAYDYTRIAPIVDRLIVMAYDEHWSTSAPGPVASLPWCSRIVDYAKSAVAIDKVVMGLPLYGRAWQDKRLAKALRFENVEDLLAEETVAADYTPELGAHFEYPEDVVVTVFYDDLRSIMDKLRLYRSRGIGSVSFWRVGQGPPELWSSIGTPPPRDTSAEGDPSETSRTDGS
jgi:spore germination protein YaaH